MTEALAKQPTPNGSRLTIVTNAGGPGVLATDALIGGGGTLSAISDETMNELNGVLPSAWSHNNPIDVLGDAGADRYAQALEIARERGVAAPVAVLLQGAEHLAALTATAVPVLKHDVLPWIEQAVSGVTATFAFGKPLAAQVSEHG